MSRRRRPQHRSRTGRRGSSVLYAIVLSPILLLSLAFAVELGALQLERQRLRSALDEAVTVAATRDSASASGHVSLDGARAADLVRSSIADNLRPLAADLDGADPDVVAASAEVAVVTAVPAPDPFADGARLERPSVVARLRVPVRTGFLHLAGLPDSATLTLTAAADLRVVGGEQP